MVVRWEYLELALGLDVAYGRVGGEGGVGVVPADHPLPRCLDALARPRLGDWTERQRDDEHNRRCVHQRGGGGVGGRGWEWYQPTTLCPAASIRSLALVWETGQSGNATMNTTDEPYISGGVGGGGEPLARPRLGDWTERQRDDEHNRRCVHQRGGGGVGGSRSLALVWETGQSGNATMNTTDEPYISGGMGGGGWGVGGGGRGWEPSH